MVRILVKKISALVAIGSLAFSATGFELVQKDIQVHGFNIHYAEAGKGPNIILLHGLWGGINEWQPILEEVSKTNHLMVMDFIGFHRSDKPQAEYHNALLSQFLAGFIEELQLKDVTLMGHAMGANTATYTAYHHPQNITRLVLADGAGYRSPNRDLAKPLTSGMIKFRRTATGSTVDSTEQFLKRRVKDPSIVTREWAEHAYYLWLNSAKAIADMLREGGDLTEAEMRKIKIPTLVLWGAEDKVFPVANANLLKKDIKGTELHIIENSGHLPQMEQTESFLNALLPFLNKP